MEQSSCFCIIHNRSIYTSYHNHKICIIYFPRKFMMYILATELLWSHVSMCAQKNCLIELKLNKTMHKQLKVSCIILLANFPLALSFTCTCEYFYSYNSISLDIKYVKLPEVDYIHFPMYILICSRINTTVSRREIWIHPLTDNCMQFSV